MEAARDRGEADSQRRRALTGADLPDAALVARCRAGDEAAWAALVERFSRYVYAIIAQGFRLSDSDAEDVFQDVFLKLYARLDQLRADEAVRPWLAQLTRRACLDHLRAARPTEPIEAYEPADLDDTIELLEEAWMIRDLLATLSDPCREILDRFFARDESYRVIGEALELPPGTVASRISRCLGALRKEADGRFPAAPASGGQEAR